MNLNYKKAGVDVDLGDALVDWLSTQKGASPHHDKVVAGIGGFASLFRLPLNKYKKPCLVSCTDGVGTKVKLASHFRDFSGVGQDLVAMCVNDLVCTGGEPLFFLDYYATGKLELENAKSFLASVRKACDESHCALVGGETAEMPGVYQDGDFDCAGFSIGIVDEDDAWGASKVRDGDVLLGVASSGFHSNGYSLLRRVFEKDLEKYREPLLRPTRLYTSLVRELKLNSVEVHAAAHITGGGMENIPRVIPDGLEALLRDWQWPSEFLEVQKRTGMSKTEMQNTLNCGIGFVLVLPEAHSRKARELIDAQGWPHFDLGKVQRK